MAILYLHTAPPPKLAKTDAGYQETSMLKSRFGGVELSLFPLRHPSRLLPRAAYGWHLRERLRQHEARLLLNHVFMPSIQHYPILKVLNNPTLLSIQAGIHHMTERKSRQLRKVAQVLVNNPRDATILEKWGIGHHTLVHPGINTDHIIKVPANKQMPFTLLMASAPWEKGQFASKGIDLLLQATANLPDLKLILLWRGTLIKELHERIKHWGLKDRVQVINKFIDINEIMPEVHAVTLLASATNLVKAYPHSLIEGLAAGKPLLTSPAIPMSDYIQAHNLGEVLAQFTLDDLKQCIERLQQQYDQKRSAVLAKGASDFDPQRMLEEMEHIYRDYGVEVK